MRILGTACVLVILVGRLFSSTPGGETPSKIPVFLFGSKDCDECHEVRETLLPPLEIRYPLDVRVYYIDDDTNFFKLIDMEKKYGDEDNPIPVVFVGDRVLGGIEEIQSGLDEAVQTAYEVLQSSKKPQQTDTVPPVDTTSRSEESKKPSVEIVYIAKAGCKSCDRVHHMLRALEGRYPNVVVKEVDVGETEGKELAEAIALAYGLPDERRLIAPSVFVGDTNFVGNEINYDRLSRAVEKGGTIPWETVNAKLGLARTSIIQRFRSMSVLGVLGAGLLDGINPCAFATLIFFISYLAFSGRRGRNLLAVGLAFALGLFVAYLAIGLGAYGSLKFLIRTRYIARIVYGAFGAASLAFAGLSYYDYRKARAGKYSEFKLQLPFFLKRKIHEQIRTGARVRAFMVGAFVSGVFISVLELACTGQVYLPTIVFVSGVPELKHHAIAYLILYNIMFILPLLAVLAVVYYGTTADRVSQFAESNLAKVKLGLAILFVVLGALLIVMALR